MRSPGVSLWVDVTWDRGDVRVGESFRGQVVKKSFGFLVFFGCDVDDADLRRPWGSVAAVAILSPGPPQPEFNFAGSYVEPRALGRHATRPSVQHRALG